MNVNRYCGDDEAAIDKNLGLLSVELGVEKDRIIMPHQTHDTRILAVTHDFISSSMSTKNMLLEGVDALITKERRICIGVSTADCIPVIIYDSENHAAATIHAGWRGTVKRIAAKAVDEMKRTFLSHPESLKAVIGPGISAAAFEVGDEVYEEFVSYGFNMNEIGCRKGKWHIDLPKCNILQLIDAGVKEENITDTRICTYNNAEDYFSARRLGIKSGRIFTGIVLH